MTTTEQGLRARLHAMLEAIPAERLDDAVLALQELQIPYDDEPVTEEELQAIREGREEYLRGETISGEEIRREFGF